MNCKCHDEPMYWQIDRRRPCQGYWYCAVKHREAKLQAYWNDPIAAARRREEPRRRRRIARMEAELKELLNAT